MSDDEVTVWIRQLAAGNQHAAQAIWTRYFQQLEQLARRKLGNAPRRLADEEDAALSAMHSFCAGMAEGRFPDIQDRDELWRLLVTITARKAFRQLQHNRRLKRGGGEVRGESVFDQRADAEEAAVGIAGVMGTEPTPELAATLIENCDRLLAALPDEALRQVAQLRLQGYANEEIATRMNCAVRTVERKLDRIRKTWSGEMVS